MKPFNRIIRSALAVTLASTMLAGCSDDYSRISSGSGFLSIAIEPQLLALQESGGPVALPGIDNPDPADFELTLADIDGQYSGCWERFADFTQNELYFTGAYEATASYGLLTLEGFNVPTFVGTVTMTVNDNALTAATIRPELVNTVFMTEFAEDASDLSLLFHTPGGMDYIFSPDASDLLFLDPAPVDVSIVIPSLTGEPLVIPLTTMEAGKAGYFYRLTVSAPAATDGSRAVTLSFKNSDRRPDASLTVTPAMLASAPALVTFSGVSPSEPLYIVEGAIPTTPVCCTVSGLDGDSRLILSSLSASLAAKGFPASLDIMNPSADLTRAEQAGLKVTRTGAGTVTIDFTEFIGNLYYTKPIQAISTFALKAVSPSGISSLPAGFNVTTIAATVDILSEPTAIVGTELASMTIRTDTPRLRDNMTVEVSPDGGSTWVETRIESFTPDADNTIDVTFAVPAGVEPIPVRILYCGEPRATAIMGRCSPLYTLEADPFATYVVLRVTADTPELTAVVTKYATLTVDGQPASVYSRNPETGLITVIDVKPDSRVTISSTMLDSERGTAAEHTVTVRTERASGVPNGDFEDMKETIRYAGMPQGGRYAQYTVDIFNRQHTTSFRLSTPTGWATVNDKTFCRRATNHNTWYMQPSTYTLDVDQAYSGGYAVELVSTAWDTDGPDIPDYLPPGPPFHDYSLEIPEIAYRAAGRLFLGEYSFDAATVTETYTEGIAWSSRPSALNGFYRYDPSPANRGDNGLVEVEILGLDSSGREITLASARGLLHVTASYTSFSLPLTYTQFGVKATKLKIMFASSESAGTIAHETVSVLTQADPVTSTSIGSRLQLDKLEFAY